MVSGSISLPLPGFFSPFPHGTSSLSVNQEYLALEDGPPIFKQDTTCLVLLFELAFKLFLDIFIYGTITLYRLFFQKVLLISIKIILTQALPCSLATTKGISIDFFSSRYSDVSFLSVSFIKLYIHLIMMYFHTSGFPIRILLIKMLLTARQYFSQFSTSFIASDCLGIHHIHLVT